MKPSVTTLLPGLLLLGALLLPSAFLSAQVETAAQDSLRVLEEIRAEHSRLAAELETLRTELDTVKGRAESPERDERIDDLERRMDDVRMRLEAIERSIGDHRDDEWEQWDDEWETWDEEDDEDGTSADWKWWSDDDMEDQFDIDETFFKRYPGNFPWSFPLTSRLHETFIRYNRVEGLYLGLAQSKRLYWHSKPWLVSTGSLGYGFANHTWRYSLGLYFPIYLENQILEFGAEGHSVTDSKDQWSFDRDENTFTAIVAREDFLDYFERAGFTATAAWYYRGEEDLNLRATIGYAHDTYESMDRATNWSIFGGDKQFRQNPRINDGNLNSLVLTLGMNTLADLDVRDHGWDAQIQYEKAGDFAAGDFAFSQVLVDLRRYQPLGDHINLNLRMRGGVSDGMLPRQRAFELGGPGTLPAYRFKEFAGGGMALVNAEFIVRSSIVGNARGWARRLLAATNLIFFADAGSVSAVTPVSAAGIEHGALPAASGDDFLDDWKSDIGVAFGSADGNFRIGAAWRLDRAESPALVVRLSRPF
ncbi:MAG: BamA/TamA family outer membrane protein [Bacteroidota bacterium]|jgi:hypothetical protein|nr:BamA/TamA family outer membrane protein [Bacteroidota bacterium]